jgi:type 1 glutamine amidotransferase
MKRLLRVALPLLAAVAVNVAVVRHTAAADPWVVYPGGDGPGKGKHVVLVSGDEEYRSEDTLTQLGRILAKHHGFKCTVLYAIDKNDGTINPNQTDNIPGLEALKTADLMVIFTRFRKLPDEQMKHIAEYVESGKPIVGLRTATHAFAGPGKYPQYHWQSKEKGWEGGFGKQVLGETWVAHHGAHGTEATRGRLAADQTGHPILRGIKDGEIFGPSDVYEARPPADSVVLVRGEVVKGMRPDDPPADYTKRRASDKQNQGINEPMMPVAWTKTFQTPDGKTAKVFTTTMGASQDFASPGLRRLLVNACYWTAGMEGQIPEASKVEIVGEFTPLPFKKDGFKKGVKPEDLQMK